MNTFLQALNTIGKEAFEAVSRVYPDVVVTRLHHSTWLAGDIGCQVYVKMESEQASRPPSAAPTYYIDKLKERFDICVSAGDKIFQTERRHK